MTEVEAIEPIPGEIPKEKTRLRKILEIVIINSAIIVYLVFAFIKLFEKRKVYCIYEVNKD